MPITDLERRLLFTQNDKELEVCSLINEVHSFTKRLFELPATAFQSEDYLTSKKKGSMSWCVEDLRLAFIE